MHYLIISFAVATLAHHLSCCYSAEPPAPRSPDPIPQVVRIEAAKMARDGVLEGFEVVSRDRRTLYQVRLLELKTGDPVIATFDIDGSLVNTAPIARHNEEPLLPPTKTIIPTRVKPFDANPDPADQTIPHRPDGRDADPSTRRGRDPADRS